MAFFIASSPHSHSRKSTSDIMMTVVMSAIPGIAALCYFFGWGVLIQTAIAALTAVVAEAALMLVRKRPVIRTVRDNSALLTGVLVGIAIPPLSPWWLAVIGTLFAIVVAKHLYGGLGQNLFNPAMVAYVVLLISFPAHMTSWMPEASLLPEHVSFLDTAYSIFTGFSIDGFSVQQLRQTVDGTTMATPLDTVKIALNSGRTVSEALSEPVFGMFAGLGWSWVNLAFLLGGLFMLQRNIIRWHIPIAMLASLFLCSLIGFVISPDGVASPIIHLFSGATMLGAFFIATDPVSASTTDKGRLVFGALIGLLIYLIRTFGSFPDGVAFAVLLANMCVPLIDYYTKPDVYGQGGRA
ncbi:electron transport complex subunit RsxD [Veronia pacifica]|uniref:Ion-translocating oxidoreductase complex subunit D n=1 Tax=Veronia pacifica TaxID=1080227 RepID=A0A1C3EJT6_9GAMM|nr:electron transport complex subunit RsxD [Veronia pacifica]ODA33483.1 electron transport complex subunit RsxD [Veronia pacifica]